MSFATLIFFPILSISRKLVLGKRMARGIPGYLLMQVHFVFFSYEEPVIFFILDYMAVMGLFVFVGHYFGRVLRNRKKKEKK